MADRIFSRIQKKMYKYDFHFMEYYKKLQDILVKIDGNTNGADLECIIDDVCIDEKGKNTYTPLDNCSGFSSFFPSCFSYKRDNFYFQIFGYPPNTTQLPKLIDMVKAYIKCRPPPNTNNPLLWEHFDLKPNRDKNAIACSINTKHDYREFIVFDAKGLLEWSGRNDKSLSEIFSKELYCCALTLDIDGKTVDAKSFGMALPYPIDGILKELKECLCDVFWRQSSQRWNANKYPPKYHVWTPENKQERKLSMRISVHFPTNICYFDIRELRRCVVEVSQMVSDSGRYLIVKYVTVNKDVRFEKSNVDSQWYAYDGENNLRVNLKEYIDWHGEIRLENERQAFVLKNLEDTFYVDEGMIDCFDGWMACHVEKDAFVECLIDDSIYNENKSLRLPTQSKLENGEKVRKFVPRTNSTVIDALVHFPHGDCEPCGNRFLVIGGANPKVEREIICSTKIREDEIVELIRKKYSMEIGTAKKVGEGRLCFGVVAGQQGKNFCLIKNDVHGSSKMYFVFDEMKHVIYLSCFSNNCQKKIKELGHNKCIPLLDCDTLVK